MNDDDLGMNEARLDYCFQASFSRLIGRQLLNSSIEVAAGIFLLSEDEEEIEFALTKIKHWVENYLSSCIAVSAMNGDGLAMLIDDNNRPILENPMLITPSEPSDHHLLYVLQAKLNALASQALEIVSLDITSSNAEGLSFSYIGDSSDMLPTMDEWVPGPNWFDVPWWHRDDVSMLDSMAPQDADMSIRPTWAKTLDHLRKDAVEHDAVVIRGEWVPKIVEDDEK